MDTFGVGAGTGSPVSLTSKPDADVPFTITDLNYTT